MSPVAGVVADTLFVRGEWVGAGQPVVSLLPPGNIKVRFYVPEPRLGAREVGQPVELRCDGCAAPIRATRHLDRAAGRVHAAGHLQQGQPREARLPGRGAARGRATRRA